MISKAKFFRHLTITISLLGIAITSCTRQTDISSDHIQRLHSYINSENEYVAEMFHNESIWNNSVQPALTDKELHILDALSDRIDPKVRKGFDQRYHAWLDCWTPLDAEPLHESDERNLLKCNGKEFQELIEFCKQQDEDIFLLLFQLAARAACPYDRLLLRPAYDLLNSFPEFSKYWREVDWSLQKEKPNLKDRICNESTIWQTRKILENKYGYTYTSGLTSLFDTRKMLLMKQ